MPEIQVESATPEERAHAEDQLSLLRRALSELPVRYRRAFVLYRFREWTTAQIANDMKIHERMARRYVSRATQYCKLRMGDWSAADARREIMS